MSQDDESAEKDIISEVTANINQRTEELFRVPDSTTDENGFFTAPVVIMKENVIFPKMISPVFISQEGNLKSIQYALESGQTAVALTPNDTASETPSKAKDFFKVGVEMAVGRLISLSDEHFSCLIQGRRRVTLKKLSVSKGALLGQFKLVQEKIPNEKELPAILRTTRDLFEQCVQLDRKIPDEALSYSTTIEDPSWLADMIATTISFSSHQRREILFELDPVKRLNIVNHALAEELDMLETGNRISEKVQNEVDKSQREYYLREQVKAIQNELNEGDPFSQELTDLKNKIENAPFNDEVRKVAMKEYEHLTQMQPMSPEIAMTRTYIDWLLDLPWNNPTEDNLDVEHAEQILNKNHYGLEKVKDRILEYIAVRSLKPKKEHQPILCFVGPPGTGKTSIGRSIAEALGRKFVRISLGGIADEAEIRGHRRTYVGALPGRIIQTMKKAGTSNPLFMLDEIDKLGSDYRGDPSAALLEVLDPEQNDKFSDHYLEVDYDLSKVMFITTANTTETIPDALLDRMELIQFSGYTEEDKLIIANEYLIKRQMEENGLEPEEIHFSDDAISELDREYTYESGVRNLEREIGKVCRKIARLKAEKKPFGHDLTKEDIIKYMGPPYFFQSEAEKKDEIGVATGLAWTPNGGDITTIEAMIFTGKGNLQITGQIGDVMQESAQAALSYIKSKAKILNIKPSDFEKVDIHIHVPEGAVPKDGPSAGITMAVAMISAFTECPVKKDLAMTGEITLRGNVLPIGGVREKLLAARRLGIHTILIPEKNIKDLVDLPDVARKDLTIHAVSSMDDVIEYAFGGVSPKRKAPLSEKKTRSKTKTQQKNK